MIGKTTFARVLLLVPLLAAGIAVGDAQPASAARECRDEVLGGTIKESIVVPSGLYCVIDGAVVRGGIATEPGASLAVQNGAEIRGSVTATSPSFFSVDRAVVRGNVTVTGATSADYVLSVLNVEVRGNLVVTGNVASVIGVNLNTVPSDVVLRDNSAPLFIVFGNTIDVNLDCANNNAVPTLFGNVANTVGGTVSPDCAHLVA